MTDRGNVDVATPQYTSIETYQAQIRTASPQLAQKEIAFFTEHPEIAHMFVSAPFSGSKFTEAEQLFGDKNQYQILRSAVLAEPPGAYERKFHTFSNLAKQEALYEEMDVSAEMTRRTVRYVEEHLKEVMKMTDKTLYKTLCEKAFGTTDMERIRSEFSIVQRRGFFLSIVNFLDDKHKLDYWREYYYHRLYRDFTKKINGGSIESLPNGFIIYLSDSEYKQFDTRKRKSAGQFVLRSADIPKDLQGKVILINKGDAYSGYVPKDELAKTRKHEINHLLFESFHASTPILSDVDVEEHLALCSTSKDYLKLSGLLSKKYTELGKNELSAYNSHDWLYILDGFPALGLDRYKVQLEDVYASLARSPRLSFWEKRTIRAKIQEDWNRSHMAIRKIWNVMILLDKQTDTGTISKEKIEALVMNTPGNKIQRLLRYVLTLPESYDLDSAMQQEEKDLHRSLKTLLPVPKIWNLKWLAKYGSAELDARRNLPRQSFGRILKLYSAVCATPWAMETSERWETIIEEYLDVHQMSVSERRRVERTLEQGKERMQRERAIQKATQKPRKQIPMTPVPNPASLETTV